MDRIPWIILHASSHFFHLFHPPCITQANGRPDENDNGHGIPLDGYRKSKSKPYKNIYMSRICYFVSIYFFFLLVHKKILIIRLIGNCKTAQKLILFHLSTVRCHGQVVKARSLQSPWKKSRLWMRVYLHAGSSPANSVFYPQSVMSDRLINDGTAAIYRIMWLPSIKCQRSSIFLEKVGF